MASATKILRDKISTVLTAIDKIKEVKDDPSLELSGFPSAVIIPAPEEAERESSNQNLRMYAFKITIYQDLQESGMGEAMLALYDLKDDILDAFDQDETFSGISLPAGYTMIAVDPAVSDWIENPDSKLLGIEITLNIRVSVDLS